MNLSKKHILLLASISISFFILLTVGLLWKNANTIHIHSAEEQRKINSETNPGKVEFIYTEQEQRDIAKWKNKSMDDLIMDAMNGDRVALYNLGEYFLLGLDFPIDVRTANSYFAESASLGFAPALDEVAQMYINDESNVFLGLVYKNLTISFGHTEFTQIYHDFRNKIIKDSGKKGEGQRIVNEIERIASHKRAVILKNQNWAENKQKNKESCRLSLMDQITHEDYQYDKDYWLDVFNGDNEIFDLTEIKEKDNTYFEKLYYLYQEAIEPDQKNLEDIGFKIQEIIKTMAQCGYSDSEIKLLCRQAHSQAKKVYKYVQKIKKDAEEAEKTIREAKQQLKMLEEHE